MYVQIFELDPAKFFLAWGLVWQAAFKKTKIKLELLAEIDILLMVEKWITGELCHSINNSAKASNKYMKDYDENEELSYVKYCNINSLYSWSLSQNFPANGLKWV